MKRCDKWLRGALQAERVNWELVWRGSPWLVSCRQRRSGAKLMQHSVCKMEPVIQGQNPQILLSSASASLKRHWTSKIQSPVYFSRDFRGYNECFFFFFFKLFMRRVCYESHLQEHWVDFNNFQKYIWCVCPARKYLTKTSVVGCNYGCKFCHYH